MKHLVALMMCAPAIYTHAQDLSNYATFFEGEWRLEPVEGALCVGPYQGSCSWWSNSASDVTTRGCLFDDKYIFHAGGTFTNDHGDETWVEEWQDGNPEGCREYVTKDTWANNSATWAFNPVDSELTINYGYLGRLSPHNSGVSVSLDGIVDSRTYLVENVDSYSVVDCDGQATVIHTATVHMNYPTGSWQFKLLKGEVYGCMDSDASNYCVSATIDDGSCQYFGCTDNAACNYDAQANVDDGSCVPDDTGVAMRLDMDNTAEYNGDFSSYEGSWDHANYSILDNDGTEVAAGSLQDADFVFDEDNPNFSSGYDLFCLAPGCYTIVVEGGLIYSAFFSWSLGTADGATTVVSGEPEEDDHALTDGIAFSIGGAICGCTEAGACNYDAAATSDDGSCLQYDDCGVCDGDNSSCSGCTDSSACNYDAQASVDDGSCLQYDDCGVCDGDNSSCSGCTDSSA